MANAASPFQTVLVPYDGSQPARAALAHAFTLIAPTVQLIVMTVVNQEPTISQSMTTAMVYDPTPLLEALDEQGAALLIDALGQCSVAGVTALTELVHDAPVRAILAVAEKHRCDLIVMGTHSRSGMPRLFLGSTTEGVLRASTAPVLTLRATDPVQHEPLGVALVAVDDSEISDAALALARELQASFGTQIVACHAFNSTEFYETATFYAFDPAPVAREQRVDAEVIVARSLGRANIVPESVKVRIVEGNTTDSILATAQGCVATLIIVGSHGRRGLRRFFLGSVAESVVRHSDVPVLVVRNWRAYDEPVKRFTVAAGAEINRPR